MTARPAKEQATANAQVTKDSLQVLKKNQPDSPLTIVSWKVEDSPDGRMPIIEVNLISDTHKRILVYVIKNDALLSNGTISHSVAFIAHDRKHALRPGVAPKVEFSGMQYSEPPHSLTLSVDFVVFTDSTRWGEDTLNTDEQLKGLRAGAQAEREALLHMLNTEGVEGLMHSLDSIAPQPESVSNHSPKWLDGFNGGVGSVREQVRRKGRSCIEIQRELQMSTDPK
jgi:hypothetical protein